MISKHPVFLFEITQRCEYKCHPCYGKILVASEHDEMRLWEWLIIIESIAELDGKLIIAGGDPFLREDLYDIVSYAKVLGVEVELATCGLNLSDDRIEELKKNGVQTVIIRLDGITPDENDAVRGVRSYDEAITALKLLKAHGMKASLVITSDADQGQLDQAYILSKQHDVSLFISARPLRGAPSIIRSRNIQQITAVHTPKVQGTIIDPEGKIFQLHDTGVQFSGDVQTKRYKVIPVEQT